MAALPGLDGLLVLVPRQDLALVRVVERPVEVLAAQLVLLPQVGVVGQGQVRVAVAVRVGMRGSRQSAKKKGTTRKRSFISTAPEIDVQGERVLVIGGEIGERHMKARAGGGGAPLAAERLVGVGTGGAR